MIKKTFLMVSFLGFLGALLSVTGQAFAGNTQINTPVANTAGFDNWLQGFKTRAAAKGVSQATIQNSLSDLTENMKVIELDRKQPEGKITFATYRERVVSQVRINKGREMMAKHKTLLEEVSAKYGVQPQFIVALWGIETDFGGFTGKFDTVRSLATLAYEGRRAEFFEGELLNALQIIDQGHTTRKTMIGSWAGALGQNQFMPSSFLAYAQDFNGDGKKDIWGTLPDVFASSANYLASSGWKGDQKWGREVKAPAGLDTALISRDIKKSIPEWQALGIRLPDGGNLPNVEGLRASLVAPDGINGPIYMTYGNYDVIMKWNRSNYFATSVGLLADKLAFAP